MRQLLLDQGDVDALSRQVELAQGDFDVLEDVVGRIFKVPIAPQDRTWMWASGHNSHIRRAAHGYEPTREAGMAAFAKSRRQE